MGIYIRASSNTCLFTKNMPLLRMCTLFTKCGHAMTISAGIPSPKFGTEVIPLSDKLTS